jgi:hypothetical protein
MDSATVRDASGDPDAASAAYRAGWDDEAEDQAMIARAKAKVDAEIAAEDMDEDSPQVMLASLQSRLVAWLRAQPDVTELDEIGDGFYGFALTAAGDVSLVLRFTSGNELANGTIAP